MIMNTKFAETLKRIRMDRGFTQEELAKKVGIEKANISCYENGRRMPRNTTICSLSEALGCEVEELMSGSSKIELNTIADIADCLFAIQEVVSDSFCIIQYPPEKNEVTLLIDKKEICEAIIERLSIDYCYKEQDLSDWAYDACKEAWQKVWSKKKLANCKNDN